MHSPLSAGGGGIEGTHTPAYADTHMHLCTRAPLFAPLRPFGLEPPPPIFYVKPSENLPLRFTLSADMRQGEQN